MDRPPLNVFKYTLIGTLVESILIAMLLVSNFTVAYYFDLFENVATPLNSTEYRDYVLIGAPVWAVGYVCSLFFIKFRYSESCCCRASVRPAHAKQIVAISNLVYHLIRWPIFFGLAAVNEPLLTVIGYWVDAIVAGAVLVLFTIFKIVYSCWTACSRRFKSELAQMRKEAQK